MLPDMSLRLQTMVRAMQDVIVPAISKNDALAREQAFIVLGSLNIIAEQVSLVVDATIVEIIATTKLLEDLADIGECGSAVRQAIKESRSVAAEGTAIAALSFPAQARLKALLKELRERADAIVEAAMTDGSKEVRLTTQEAVLAYAGPQILRWRSANRTAGFEADPDSIPPLGNLLAQARGGS